MNRSSLTLTLIALAACGGKPAQQPQVPMLPGEGTTNLAKPVAPRPPPVTDPWSKRADLVAAPAPKAQAQALALPRFDEFKLSNGLAVYVVKSDKLPVMAMQLAIRAGRLQEPKARLGVAELTADMLVKGTTKHDALGLAKAIDFVGGTIAADSTFEATLVSCSVLARSANVCFDLVPEMVTQPAFPEAELVRMRETMASQIHQRYEDPANLASAHAQNLLWGADHVRGWVLNDQMVQALRREDVVAWHRAWYVPANAMLVIVGDVDARQLRGTLERTFGQWKKGPVPPAPTYREPGLSGSRIRLVDRPGATNTQIRVAQFGLRHDDPRFFETLVWNYVLGGGPSSRLLKALREDGSEVYAASSSFDRNVDRGSFVASAVVRSNAAVATAKHLLGEVAKMAKDGPSADELAAAVANIAGSYPLRFQSAADIGAALIGAELHGFGREYLTNFPAVIAGVDQAAAKRAAGEVLDPRSYVVVLAGDAKDLEPQLRREGWRYELVSSSTQITEPPAGPAIPDKPADPAAVAAAHKLIDEAIAAKGGRARLAAIKGLRMVASGTTNIGGQNLPVDITRTLVLPDKMRIDAVLKPAGAGKPVEVTVGATEAAAWQRAPDQKTGSYGLVDITGDQLQDIGFERWREPELILLKAGDAKAQLAPAPDETIDGKPCAVVTVQTPFGIAVLLYIDKQTKLIARTAYRDAKTSETDDFSDYRVLNGLKVAYKRVSSGAGRSTTLEMKTIELDPKVDPTVFAKPAK
ncbi:MAG TPA: insulinase family protein [Kofleriaceae bacterium]